jgi:enoyl-CoA hydratase/carnithine racemase
VTKNKAVLLDVQDKVATITLNRPEVRNAFNSDILEGLKAAAEQILSQTEIRVAILTGAGDRAFCAGLDLKAAMAGEALMPPQAVRSADGWSGLYHDRESSRAGHSCHQRLLLGHRL